MRPCPIRSLILSYDINIFSKFYLIIVPLLSQSLKNLFFFATCSSILISINKNEYKLSTKEK